MPKWLTFTDLSSKFVALLPIASSQSPSSGDGLLLSKYIELEDAANTGSYVRSLLRGNNGFFVILVCDAGFVAEIPNSPQQARGPNVVTLAEVCQEENCVLLHTSNKHETYHLYKTSEGLIRKIARVQGKPSLNENTVKLSRLLRKSQEQIFAGLKGKFQIFDERHLSNRYILPFSSKELHSFGLDRKFKNSPKLNFIGVVACSLMNSTHPGFLPIYMDEIQEIRAANLFMHRMFLENPLHNLEIWPLDFLAQGSCKTWQELSFGSLEISNPLDFPQLTEDEINPTAIELVSGPHAIHRGNCVLTYMQQLLLKSGNLSREEILVELQEFPTDWKFQYTEIKTPSDFLPTPECSSWCPDWWDCDRYGPWHDLTLVRCKIPPSYKTANSPANFHTVVIGFGNEPSYRLGLRSPYDRIYFWRCFKCPSLNGVVSMDRHCAALLLALSFKHMYTSTAKPVNVLNTVACTKRQMIVVPPQANVSADFPRHINRRGTNTRKKRQNKVNPLYNLSTSSSDSMMITSNVAVISNS